MSKQREENFNMRKYIQMTQSNPYCNHSQKNHNWKL